MQLLPSVREALMIPRDALMEHDVRFGFSARLECGIRKTEQRARLGLQWKVRLESEFDLRLLDKLIV